MGLESTARYRNVTAQNGVFSRVGGDTRGMYSVQRKATHTLPVMLRGRTRTTRSTLQVWQIYRLRQLRGGLQTAAPHWPGHIPPGTCSHAALPRASALSRHCSTPPPTVPSPRSAGCSAPSSQLLLLIFTMLGGLMLFVATIALLHGQHP